MVYPVLGWIFGWLWRCTLTWSNWGWGEGGGWKFHFPTCSIIFPYQGILSNKKFSHKKTGTLTTTGGGGGVATLWWAPPKSTTFFDVAPSIWYRFYLYTFSVLHFNGHFIVLGEHMATTVMCMRFVHYF